MIKKVIFRADGSSTTGLGHLYRLFSLVEIVKDTLDFVFLTHETTTNSVISKTYHKAIIPREINIEDEPEWLAANFLPEEHIIIADGYQFNSLYQKKVKQKGYNLIYIDDLAKEYMYADVVINHSPYIQEKRYNKEPNTKLALGTKYALLRPLFLEEATKDRTINVIDSAFVCFGGADPINLTLIAVKALLQIPTFKKIHVVLGGAYKHIEIFDLEVKHSDKIKTHKNLSEERLIKVMQQCNFAVAPASTILYELSCIKMPILSGYFVDNQKNIYKGLVKEKTIIEGGDLTKYTSSDFKQEISSAINKNRAESFIAHQKNLIDGNSKNRFLGLINGLTISLRKAKEEDMLLVFKWSNDKLVRKNSYNSKPILLENHKKWFLQKIKSQNTLFLIALINDEPSGVVRFDIGKHYSTVGILVSKFYRGQKLASEFLKESAKIYFRIQTVPILAYIKKENKASTKAFENANYKYFKDENVKGSTSFVYKLEKQDVG
ncbi:UDP-2,4-diacetamido-2,4,6-trideoxy-beta-L-altropyranose hydrolase [Flavobacteriaceae bacterium S0825]|uniref:UDP-2,4-diacetamido-2,4, 6-trideoxy-beta-L-altropyranose hydrolase n=1 Tax=Gaetbulibacter sp. S0825 TaxID=2720084 RepID=UPI0014312E83|nr:UDP-2,4-diacetamido-2,4,6-trideoxy-beta-L-altropyranose hydrolase [Gaetbulibacter sp. S0825]MCK0108285.1 UDP-2,4-diacetamido-2,4,6-trideoxy-beta-L-altropyranose hydrolase [Flavobacteriaceae bacterium S0825]NIX63921.1 UDP-2,4-diacetamido-2,4,6-trideoxy-beta-L-altropyranose hydrolase [Gaetbulibacter sp. S0825]